MIFCNNKGGRGGKGKVERQEGMSLEVERREERCGGKESRKRKKPEKKKKKKKKKGIETNGK